MRHPMRCVSPMMMMARGTRHLRGTAYPAVVCRQKRSGRPCHETEPSGDASLLLGFSVLRAAAYAAVTRLIRSRPVRRIQPPPAARSFGRFFRAVLTRAALTRGVLIRCHLSGAPGRPTHLCHHQASLPRGNPMSRLHPNSQATNARQHLGHTRPECVCPDIEGVNLHLIALVTAAHARPHTVSSPTLILLPLFAFSVSLR